MAFPVLGSCPELGSLQNLPVHARFARSVKSYSCHIRICWTYTRLSERRARSRVTRKAPILGNSEHATDPNCWAHALSKHHIRCSGSMPDMLADHSSLHFSNLVMNLNASTLKNLCGFNFSVNDRSRMFMNSCHVPFCCVPVSLPCRLNISPHTSAKWVQSHAPSLKTCVALVNPAQLPDVSLRILCGAGGGRAEDVPCIAR